jgi:two-component system chemotaxis response regulator CheY
MKALCADDSRIIRRLIQQALDVLGFDMLEAADGREALDLVEAGHEEIDIVLLDWNMPNVNGFEVLRTLKGDPRYQRIPVMMVTTESERENIVKAIQAGASHYVTKPFTPEDLASRILECLGSA